MFEGEVLLSSSVGSEFKEFTHGQIHGYSNVQRWQREIGGDERSVWMTRERINGG